MEDLTKKTEEELETIIRRAENADVSGSLFQRAKIELELRDRKSKSKGPIGILNRGKNNTFVNNTFSGLRVGIQDEGENTFAEGNKFRGISGGGVPAKKWWENSWVQGIALLAAILGIISFFLIF